MLISVSSDVAPRRMGATRALGHPMCAPGSGVLQSNQQRFRILRLRRPSNGSYGFHLRGGRENGTGFFISHVEPGTEAFAQGLRAGDQVLRVNERDIGGALHKDVAALVRSGPEVVLHVRSVGHAPLKRNPNEQRDWTLVKSKSNSTDCLSHKSRELSRVQYNKLPNTPRAKTSEFQKHPVKVLIRGAGKNVLGCSICKGPPEKPGIYVQRVTEGGVAYKAGLRAGDRILNCNGTSFVENDEFQRAVQALKGSPSLNLEVLQGVGLDLVAGESSGYNSSASSETGDEPYQHFSTTDSKDKFSDSRPSTIARTQLKRNKIPLDNNRDWGEIDAEWADAEFTEKRNMLSKQASGPLSKSYLNINKTDINDNNDNPIYATCSSCAQLIPMESVPLEKHPKNLKKHQSMLDLRSPNADLDYETGGAQIIADKHVSKIIIPAAPRNEQNALRRLERLSSAPMQGCSTLPNHCKTGSICSTSSEESSYRDIFFNHNGNNMLESHLSPRNYGTQLDPYRLSSEDSDSLLSFPSSTISINDAGSGKFTSKIQIRSSPPAPPPRGNATKLTRYYRKHKCGHYRKQDYQDNGMDIHARHSFSQDSFSGSSDESIPWNEGARTHVTVTTPDNSSAYCPIIPPPPPPSLPDSAPPIPPPPPPMPPATLPKPSNGSKEGFSEMSAADRLKEITGAASRLKSADTRPIEKKLSAPNPQKLQHEKLMDEFKKAHAKMVAKKEMKNQTENTDL